MEKHFWNPDIEKMAEMIDLYKQDISEPNPGRAIQALEDFKEARIKALRDIEAHAPACESWYKVWRSKRTTLAQIDTRYEAIKEKFFGLGYSLLDLGRLWEHPEVVRTTPLNDRIWRQIRPILEPEIRRRKEQRLLRYGPYKCLRCPPDSKRKFGLMGVGAHLDARHEVPLKESELGVHYSHWPDS